MRDHKEDKDQNFRTIIFLILFSLFVLASSNDHGNHYSSSIKHATQTELVFGNISGLHNTIICDGFGLTDLQKYSECAHNSFNTISIQYKILNYNRRINQNFIQVQKTRLTIEPLFLWRLHSTLTLSEKENLPVLS